MAGRAVIRVLSVASECAPLVKTGGLADVVGALPAAMQAEGAEMRTLLPGYPAILARIGEAQELARYDHLMGGPARLLAAKVAGLDLLILEAAHLYDRPGNIYLTPEGADWADNPQRYAALCWVAAQIADQGAGDWHPDILHAHDWQGGLAADYLSRTAAAGRVKTVLTIHNVAFQGLFSPDLIPLLALDQAKYHQGAYEYWSNVSALKTGLMLSDRITTVSPTYAEELMTPEFGMGLDGVMRARRDVLSGILNGIDAEAWNPETDPEITGYKTPKGKAANKAALRAEFGLPEADGPLCIVVSRLTEQKGLDLLLHALPALLDRGGQLALLGSGDKGLEQAFRDLAARHPQVGVRIGYDEALSHRMMAGADAILVPSRFEPCGLTQLYGLRYGTLPLVALTGGLADTVINASPAALGRNVATGVQFHPIATDPLRTALTRLCDLFAEPKVWAKMQRNAMAQPVGWETSAAAYAALYRDMTQAPE